MAGTFTMRTTTEADWARVREFRIENAADNPVSYGATLAYTRTMTEADWRLRARRGELEDTTSVVAVAADTGRWLGMMSAQTGDDDGADPVLTGVYVTPEARGRQHGVADALLGRVLGWAEGRGRSLRLYVDEHAVPAARFYTRHGFLPTGRDRSMHVLGEPPEAAPRRLLERTRALDVPAADERRVP